MKGRYNVDGENVYGNNLPHHTFMESNLGHYGWRLHVQHLCDISPWPLILALILFVLVSGFITLFRVGNLLGFCVLLLLCSTN